MDFLTKTRRTQITKSLELKLVPEKATERTMEASNVLAFDDEFEEKLNFIAPFVDKACLDMIMEPALNGIDYDFTALYVAKDERAKRAEEEEKLTSAIAKAVSAATEDTAIAGDVAKIKSAPFIDKMVHSYVINMPVPADTAEMAGADIKAKAVAVIDSLKGMNALMQNFLTTRVIAITTWMPRRVIENFYRFAANADKITAMNGTDIGEKVFTAYPELQRYGDINFYNECLTKTDIENYNKLLSGTHTETENVQGAIELINLYNQDAKRTQGMKTYPNLESLYKQVLTPKAKAYETEKLTILDEVRKLMDEADFSVANRFADIVLDESVKPSDVAVKGGNLRALSYICLNDWTAIMGLVVKKTLSEIDMTGMKPAAKRKAFEKAAKACVKRVYTFEEINDICGDNVFALYRKSLKEAVDVADAALADYKKNCGREDIAPYVKAVFDAQTAIRDLSRLIKRPDDSSVGDNIMYAAFEPVFDRMYSVSQAERLVLAYFTRKPADIEKKRQTYLGNTGRATSEWYNPETNDKISKQVAALVRMDNRYYYITANPDDGRKPWKPVEGTGAEILSVYKLPAGMAKALGKFCFPPASYMNHVDYKTWDYDKKGDFIVDYDVLTESVHLTKELRDIYLNKTYCKPALKKGLVTEEEYKTNLLKILTYYTEFLKKRKIWNTKLIDFDKLSDLSMFADSGEYCDILDSNPEHLEWDAIDRDELMAAVSRGDLYMYLIDAKNMYNDNASQSSYVRMFKYMLNEGINTVTLNSRPTVFYRKAAIKPVVRHPKGSCLVGKCIVIDGHMERIPENIYEEIYQYMNSTKNKYCNVPRFNRTMLSNEADRYLKAHTGQFKLKMSDHDIIKDERYTKPMYKLKITYTAGSVSRSAGSSLDAEMKEYAKSGNVLTIVRNGEELIHYIVTDKDGRVFTSRSLNVINGVDYYALLRKIDRSRKSAKSNDWEYDRTVKEWRDPYFALAIREILKDVLKYNAVIAIEKASQGMKDKYSAFDNNAFKTFETMLRNRLTDLFFEKEEDENGKKRYRDLKLTASMANPLQLATNNGKDWQDGILFFVPGAYTATMDPETGFVDNLVDSDAKSNTAKAFFLAKYDEIRVVNKDGAKTIKIEYDADNFRVRFDAKKTKWTLYAGHEYTKLNSKHRTEVIENVPEMIEGALASDGLDPTGNIAEYAKKGLLKKSAAVIFEAVRAESKGFVYAHDGNMSYYISPVTGKRYDKSYMAALNLTDKFRRGLNGMKFAEYVDTKQAM